MGGSMVDTQFVTAENRRAKKELECGLMPNVMATLPNIGGAPAEHCKVSLTPTARVLCSNAANIGECNTWTQSEFCTWQSPRKYLCSVQAQETAKQRAKFGWLPLSDVAAGTKPR